MNNISNIISPIVKVKSCIDGINLYIKREDLLPFSFGGNKLRIAFEFFNDMQENNYNCIICYGSSRSNLCRVIANISKSLNIECHIVSPVDDKNETTNSLLVDLFGAIVHKCEKSDVANTVENVINKCEQKGLKPYYIYGNKFGIGNEAIPVNAYVETYKEICKQANEMGINFDYIFCPSGTGMTQAGLIVGNYLNENPSKIIGISVARRNEQEVSILQKYVSAYCAKYNIPNFLPEIIFKDEYLCGGYSLYDKEIVNTIKNEISINGIPLDTTYTGKAFYGMLSYLKENSITNKNVLFIHTGGTPLFFDNFECLIPQIDYKYNSTSYEELFEFIKSSDFEFNPSLSSRVNLQDYAKKLHDNGSLFEAYIDGKLVALVAMYANDNVTKKAYITYVYCKKEYRKLGIANQLIKNAFEKLKENNFKSVSLEVTTDNIPAVNLYKKFGFEITNLQSQNSLKSIMQAILGGGGNTKSIY